MKRYVSCDNRGVEINELSGSLSWIHTSVISGAFHKIPPCLDPIPQRLPSNWSVEMEKGGEHDLQSFHGWV